MRSLHDVRDVTACKADHFCLSVRLYVRKIQLEKR